MPREIAPVMVVMFAMLMILTGRILSCSTSIFTGIRDAVAEPVIRPAGRHWWPNSWQMKIPYFRITFYTWGILNPVEHAECDSLAIIPDSAGRVAA